MTAPVPPPVPDVEAVLRIGAVTVDLRCRVLVAGVVPVPRFGREAEVQAGAAAVLTRGADLVDVSLPPRLAGAVTRAPDGRAAMRAATLDELASARALGAHVVMVPPTLAAHAPPAPPGPADGGASLAVVADDPHDLPDARALAERLGLPLAFDSTRWSGPAATGHEAAAVARGCRLLRTTDVRRSRRVAEVMAALLSARRPARAAAETEPGGVTS